MKNFLKKYRIPRGHREYYFVMLLGVILVIIVFLIMIISFQASDTTNVPTHRIIYSPTAPPITSPSTIPHTRPPLLHNINIQAASELVTREEYRTPLSQPDAQAKANILKLLPSGQTYGTVYSSNNIDIEYLQSLDLFDVYILTIDVASAKKEAENWFKQQGMSQQGICDLPLGFYLSPDTANLIKNTNFIFNPLPDGC